MEDHETLSTEEMLHEETPSAALRAPSTAEPAPSKVAEMSTEREGREGAGTVESIMQQEGGEGSASSTGSTHRSQPHMLS